MPHWPSRLLPGSSAPSSSTSPDPAPDNVPSRPRRKTQTGAIARSPSPEHPPLPPTRPLLDTSPARRSSNHGRSVSHPFPTPFSNGRRPSRTGLGNLNGMETDTKGKVAFEPEQGQARNVLRTPSRGGHTQFNEKDMVTGKCATCDSTVRWPRHLDVYRCTVCLMINDLKSSKTDVGHTIMADSPRKTDIAPGIRIPRKVLPLSLDRTRNLIDQCLESYLRNRVTRSQHGGDSLSGRSTSDYFQSRSVDSANGIPAPPSRAAPQVPSSFGTSPGALTPTPDGREDSQASQGRTIFRALENYLVASLHDCTCLNTSFIFRSSLPARAASESHMPRNNVPVSDGMGEPTMPLSGLDAKTLLIGDVAENGLWWTGSRPNRNRSQRATAYDPNSLDPGDFKMHAKSLRINWAELDEWYHIVFSCGSTWRDKWQELRKDPSYRQVGSGDELKAIEHSIVDDLADARVHVQRTFLKATEVLLKRPGQPLGHPEDCRFLLILLSNPLLYPQNSHSTASASLTESRNNKSGPNQSNNVALAQNQTITTSKPSQPSQGNASGQHSGLIKRILGLIANLPHDCHQTMISWFCRLPETHFRRTVDLVGGFVSYRLNRLSGRKQKQSVDLTAGLIPDMSGPGGTSAQLHAALAATGNSGSKSFDSKEKHIAYADDWQTKAAAKVMSLLYAANNSGFHRRRREAIGPHEAARQLARRHAQLLPTSEFYNSILDYADLVADFEAWESKRGKFSFCQYPMFLSIWAKIHIMEHDARRQMEVKARDAFFESILTRKALNQYLVLKVRRQCLVDDSLKAVSQVVGSNEEEIKKGLKIEFLGEEGIDGGGLRKEWFLLLVREVFDPEYGMFSARRLVVDPKLTAQGLFVYDEDSHYCYFNPNTFETSDQFFLVGVVVGLAIYNSTILDVAFPPFAFRKLLASAPIYTGPATSSIRPTGAYSLDDLAEFRPALANGLRQLLEFEGNVEETFCRDFVIEVERYGHTVRIPLCTNGENRAVTNSNRREFVDLYIQYLLDAAVARQFEPFKRGFFTVCGGNALSLFQPEEIELLVRGSDESLDVNSLRAVAIYEGWSKTNFAQELVIDWFWGFFTSAEPKFQRRILSFITGSDRLPAMGAINLVIKVTCLGDHPERFPQARTCFNTIGLFRYRARRELETKLTRAVEESEGFGLK